MDMRCVDALHDASFILFPSCDDVFKDTDAVPLMGRHLHRYYCKSI